MRAAPTEKEEAAVADVTARKRKRSADDEPDVVAHVAVEPVDDDPERKRKRKRKKSDAPEGDEAGRKRK
jgi:hypothetical protein